MKIIIKIILYFWQWPQILASLFFRLFVIKAREEDYKGIKIIYIKNIKEFGISFGPIIFLSNDERGKELKYHEYGHSIQSLILGGFYPLIVGLPSIIMFFIYNNKIKKAKNDIEILDSARFYFSHFPENWANSLAKVNIEEWKKFKQ